jgi:hypothetical protein
MRRTLAAQTLLPLAVSCFTTALRASDTLAPPASPRVRAIQPAAAELLAEAARRSDTFAGLIAALERSDLIVYVEMVPLPRGIDGRLQFAAAAGPNRYLRVQVRPDMPRDRVKAVIGHELQHALEVAEASEVRDQRTLAGLYERIGTHGASAGRFDTRGAQKAEQRVRAELIRAG